MNVWFMHVETRVRWVPSSIATCLSPREGVTEPARPSEFWGSTISASQPLGLPAGSGIWGFNGGGGDSNLGPHAFESKGSYPLQFMMHV